MKLDNMTDRDILIWLMGEVRDIRKSLDNHLRHCWQVVIALVGIAGVAVTSLLIALLA
jgi:hypothetical protein